MVLARLITQVDMATYRQVLYIGPLAVSLLELGISGTIYRYARVFTGDSLKVFYWETLCVTTALGVLGSLVLVALAYPLARTFDNPALATALLITGSYPLLTMPFMLVRPLLICNGYPLRATLLEAFFALATSFAMIVPLWSGWSLNAALGFWIGVNACRLPFVGWYMARELKGFIPHWNRDVLKQVWDYIWPLQLSRLPGIAIGYFDKVCTSLFLSKESFAAYSLGARELPFMNQIAFSISSVTIPKMTESFQRGQVAEVCALWRKACFATALATFLPAAFCVWYAQPIVRVMFTALYDESAIPFAVFAAITFLRVVDYGSLAKAMGDNRIVLVGSVFAALTGIPLSLGLTWLWGVKGISFSLLLCNILLIAYYLWRYRKIMKCSLRCFFPYIEMGMVLLLSFVCIGIAHGLVGRVISIETQTHMIPLAVSLGGVFVVAGTLYAGAFFLARYLMPQRFTDIRLPGFKR